ncbi:unnamed protein product [Didymodactylos carnosus]|uniref:Uncharacterized protein n=1 Tax=Didymodactylos carnosus TaxID=1234261 RepID=A0A814R6G4_9BILA|nr:unnamed protein product [Didymodactylos carnosus]CAF1127783.1 unnamed protein product [Didymodactylos carnosus]CAF3597234.1 unnamed protein product [Didymodactylos carnosus]CAF3891318.1 unnamed protein product [Didymodactylos carnosus]
MMTLSIVTLIICLMYSTANNLNDSIRCYANCTISQSFDEQLSLDNKCTEHIHSENCYAEMIFNYKERQVQIVFGKYYTGQSNSNAADTNNQYNMIKTTTMDLTRDNKMTKIRLIYTCKKNAQCDKEYVEKVYDEYILMKTDILEDELASLLFDDEFSSTTNSLTCRDNSQCYNHTLCVIHYHIPLYKKYPSDSFCEPSYKRNQSVIIIETIEGTTHSPTRIHKCNTNNCLAENYINQIDEIFEKNPIIKSVTTVETITSRIVSGNE